VCRFLGRLHHKTILPPPTTGVREAPRHEIAVSSLAFDEIARYDGTVFPAARPSFLRRWIRQPQGAAFGVQGKQRLEGYEVLRACRPGFKIGPLFADDPHIAGSPFQGLASRVRS
jgi:Acetyltransferase (GNAT) domain